MKYLLDTHALIWIAANSPQLSARVRLLLDRHPTDTFGMAAISLVEFARIGKAGAVEMEPNPVSWMNDLTHRFEVLPLTPAIAWRSVELDWAHKDPADRLICATALEHRLTLITHDKEVTRWGGVPVVW